MPCRRVLMIFKKFSMAAVILCAGLSACTSSTIRVNPELCATRYPIILVHGFAFRDTTGGVRYWGNTADFLKGYGAKVYVKGGDAYGLIPVNAAILKKNIVQILSETGAKKVNIIAHSRGGLEARYMISRLDMADKVASVTTVATPHRGSPVADLLIHKLDKGSVLTDIVDFNAKILGDVQPESFNAGEELTTDSLKVFNMENPDMPGVYYQSYAGAIGETFPNPLWRKISAVITEKEGENDGLVSVTSAKWGNFRGVATCDGEKLVSHADLIGMHLVSGEFCFNAPEFYRQIVSELRFQGF